MFCSLPLDVWKLIIIPIAQSSCFSVLSRTCKTFRQLLKIESKKDYERFKFEDYIDISKEAMDDHKKNETTIYDFDNIKSREFWSTWHNEGIEIPNSWREVALKSTLYYQEIKWRQDRFDNKKLPHDSLQIQFIRIQTSETDREGLFIEFECRVKNHRPEFTRTQVFIHFTTNEWKDVSIEPLEFYYKGRHNEESRWRWYCKNETFEKLLFAFKVQDTHTGEGSWDNNDHKNYCFHSHGLNIIPIVEYY